MKVYGMPVKPLRPTRLDGLGSQGLNTQASSSTLGPEWLTEATNVVFDFQGRLGPRKGIKAISEEIAAPVTSIGEYIKADRTTAYYVGSGSAIYLRDTSTVPETLTAQSFASSPQTISNSNWQWINFNSEFWGIQTGHSPINLTGTTWTDVIDLGTYHAPAGVTTFDPNCALGDFGRMWYGGVTEDLGTLYYSDNLIGEKLNAGAAGVIDLHTVWGQDEIVGLASLMDKIIIFGKNNIVIYNGASDPNTMSLDELIKGVGLAGRDNIIYMGADLLFLSYEGLQSLSRIVQTDGKAPITDLSIATRNTLAYYLSTADLSTVKSVYHQEDGLVITFVPENKLAYVFDFSSSTQLSIPRITVWNFATSPLCGLSTLSGDLLMGLPTCISKYDGYYDTDITNTTSTNGTQSACLAVGGTWLNSKCWSTTNRIYNYTWGTAWLDLGEPAVTKILKEAFFSYTGGRGSATTLSIFIDHKSTNPLIKNFNLAPAEDYATYGDPASQYNVSKFTSKVGPVEYKIPLGRTGKVIRMKMVTEVTGDYSSLVSMTLLTKQGKIR
tara:strand:- start:603 stop:2261 length:1659 start_codon:yes stop_codon:yes gene_type:complete